MGLLDSTAIGCIGAGNMGSAILAGLARRLDPSLIACYDTDAEKLQSICGRHGLRAASNARELAALCGIVILAVKPDTIPAVLTEIKNECAGKICVSIAAGVGITAIEAVLSPSQKIARVMPNTPALVGEGMSVISANAAMDDASLAMVEEIFSLLGRALVLPEKLMNAVTGLSGSGPAYVFTMIQAMADGGVKMGIPRDRALVLAAQTVLGAARMALESGDDPITLRGRVTSPAGTTIEGVHVLEKSGFSGIIIDAVEAATRRSEKLGEKK